MKNWIRIFLVCFALVGGTAFFVYQSLNQFNNAFDSLSASTFAIAKIPPISFFNKTNKEQIPTSSPETISTTATSTDVSISTSATSTFVTSTDISTTATSTDLKLSFVFPKKNSKVYIGCAYQLSFQSSTPIHLLEIALIDDGTNETVEPIASGLARENKIEPNSQSLDWKVGVVWPGKYYIKVSNINGVELENYSKSFTISRLPKGISVDEKEKICKESNGSLNLLDKS